MNNMEKGKTLDIKKKLVEVFIIKRNMQMMNQKTDLEKVKLSSVTLFEGTEKQDCLEVKGRNIKLDYLIKIKIDNGLLLISGMKCFMHLFI